MHSEDIITDNKKPLLLVLGVHLKSEGYPNVLYRIRDLRHCESFQISEINIPMWKQPGGHWQESGLWRGIWRAVWSHMLVLMRYVFAEKDTVVYVPYPAVFVLALISLLPRGLRPKKLVADAFISIYDTVVHDRGILLPQQLAACLLKAVEARGYGVADVLVADTEENVQHLEHMFSIRKGIVVAVPLSTDEENFSPKPYHSGGETCRVLFIGTFVPLHGVDFIVRAAEQLKTRRDIRFKLIGNGQTADTIDRYLKAKKVDIEWEKGWQTPAQLALEIEQADICLGIFGRGDKAQRVCPFKIYSYCAVGRAIITADTRWTRRVSEGLSYEPFICVPTGDPADLADAVAKLAEQPALREKGSVNSRRFYESKLSNDIAMQRSLEFLG
jgi:glycosyltransferase involved in cell wall biosynthesis